MRTSVAVLVGLVIGILVGAGWTSTDAAYEYTLVVSGGPNVCGYHDRSDMIRNGWRIVPNQSDGCYFRRHRLAFLR